MDPVTGSLIGTGISTLGRVAQTQPAGPSRADGYASGQGGWNTAPRSSFDGSGWTVSTGSSKAVGAGLNTSKLLLFAGVAVGALILWRMHK